MNNDFIDYNKLFLKFPNQSDKEMIINYEKKLFELGCISEKSLSSWVNINFGYWLNNIINDSKGFSDKECYSGVSIFLYYLIYDNEIIGSGSLRINPECNNILKETGGHIGYGIRPDKRGKGFGTYFCHLLLEKAQENDLSKVMITCKEDNIGSSKIIENNFGEYIDKVKDRDNVTYKRYLIDVEKSLIEFNDKINKLK